MRQLSSRLRSWGLYIYNKRDSRSTRVEKRVCQRQITALSRSVHAPSLSVGNGTTRHFSWSLDMPDYYKHKLWDLLVLRNAPVPGCSIEPDNVHRTQIQSLQSRSISRSVGYKRFFSSSTFQCSPGYCNVTSHAAITRLSAVRTHELTRCLRMWLSCPLSELQSMMWMFWVMLDLACRPNVIAVVEHRPRDKHIQVETRMHINAAAVLLGLMKNKATTEEQTMDIGELGLVLSCWEEALVSNDQSALDVNNDS